jgi:hypothetical protein
LAIDNHDGASPPFAVPRKEVAVLQVTTRAAEYMRDHLSRKREGLPEAIRVVRTDDGFQLTLDDPKDGDHIFEREGENYLLVAPELGEALADATIDLQQSPQGLSLTLTTSASSLSQSPAEAGPQPERPSEANAEAEPRAEPDSKPEPEAETETKAETEP